MTKLVEPIFVALGSNLGDRAGHIRDAVALLAQSEGFEVVAVAPLYESAPMYVEDQPRFVNTCLKGRTSLTAEQLLALLKSVESEIGRRVTYRNGPRVIDLDIVYFGGGRIETGDLIVPHPRRGERMFVLQPLADLAPDFIDPETGDTIAALMAALTADPGEPPLRRLD
ncbi:2-amino-4-hydroxy-6-hydroxymethyldihydropteridine diphosphokinase [Hwanghaeella grinnelliae]|uniref:2-amino-4-hydroxy-6-hydroxymethyldihydropteridine pyrophosphokinase n=1 Tax=Hwanghaeella grinnelliae TaxID=2500179 RepID=A0A437QHZ8_9PROT|nr:2-amino-4-hydroxy-6-hydroxymethyldihydropteridine diphosphokinase [Hwanghaeella grinnelliae]RVU34165.1 2-amino-4-hydroxy-6-hydroxymethyldihydropteridine diphosphokinase [Hwanghaeella grinnelliae]